MSAKLVHLIFMYKCAAENKVQMVNAYKDIFKKWGRQGSQRREKDRIWI